ncbi:MAG: DUF484 family protein [Proteobacteria bacterium]|nr:DUF484 family protein [Pseudomonadota bacterium]
MTTPQPKSEAIKAARSDSDETRIAAFLAANPDFFDRHSGLLGDLRLPHARGDASTVSLVERQVEVLRVRVRDFEEKLRALVENGRANDALATKMHRLACRLIGARDGAARLAAIESSLREDFGAREFTLLVCSAVTAAANPPRYLRQVAADDAGLKSFDSLHATGKPRCGRIRDMQRDFLFPSADIAIGSVALVPLRIGGAHALLAIASPDADHFNPTMSTDFLARIGELVATALDGAPVGVG